MNKRLIVAVASMAVLLFGAGVASARNPHCAGGIQYVVQGLRDKDRGMTEDYTREMNKAVDQLTQCSTEDPADLEALGYLGWALAEVDSCGPAGVAFQKAIDGLNAKGDKKKLDPVEANRDHYWSAAYNDGIKHLGDAQQVYPDFTKDPANDDEKKQKEEAARNYAAAIQSLTRAKLLKPTSALTIRNLGTAYALQGRYAEAEVVLKNGLTEAAGDKDVSGLSDALKTVQANTANQLLETKDFPKAIAYYTDMTKAQPDNADAWSGLGSAYFNSAQTKQDAARRADFKAAGDAYAKAFQLKAASTDLGFNAALAYQGAGELALSETAWRAVLKVTPDDPEALSALGSTLADMQKFDEAVTVLKRAVDLKPDNKTYHRQLGAVYSKAGNSAKSTEHLMVFMAMNTGTEAPDTAGVAKAAKGAGASTFSANGAPNKIYDWESDGRKLQTWLYFSKKLGFTFDAGGMTLVQKSDWSASAGSAPSTKSTTKK